MALVAAYRPGKIVKNSPEDETHWPGSPGGDLNEQNVWHTHDNHLSGSFS